MAQTIAEIVPPLVLASHVFLAVIFLAVLGRNGWGKPIYDVLSRQAVRWGFLVALGAVFGSLFYSEAIGFEACVLCWWQRVFLYPLAPIFAVAVWKRDRSVFNYAIVLALLALVIGGYQEISNLTGASLLTCTDAEGACSKVFVKEFGYITIPVMSITVSLYILLLAWANKLFRTNND